MSEPLPIDFHVHLDLYPDMIEAYRYCGSRNAITLAVTTTPRAFERNREVAEAFPNIHVGLGMHPQLLSSQTNDLKLFERLAESSRFIGEVGLDAGREHYQSFQEQQRVFEHVLRLCNEQQNKVISVHSVRTAGKVLSVLEKTRVFETCQIVLHWFSASLTEIERAVAMGCFFSVNEVHLRNEAGRRLIQNVPQASLLTETDGPFVERAGAVVQASDVGPAVRQIAELLDIRPRDAANLIEKNAWTLLSSQSALAAEPN